MNEGIVHVAVRQALKDGGWRLIAGQYPGGSDDELPILNIVDPTVACDNSPDPRRHSGNKLVPDLVALKKSILLIVEIKPRYSRADENKLQHLLGERRQHLYLALRKFSRDRGQSELSKPEKLIIVPCLGFAATSRYVRNPQFAYLLVHDLQKVQFSTSDAMNAFMETGNG
jgi:Holliday junction resolvase